MTKRCRNKVRNRGPLVRTAASETVKMWDSAQPVEDWLDWLYFRKTTAERAEAMVAAGKAERVRRMVDGRLETVGYRKTRPERMRRRSAATLTFGTMVAVGNHAGQQADVQVTPGEQRHYEKFAVWPFIGDTRNTATVRPRVSVADWMRAQAIDQQSMRAA